MNIREYVQTYGVKNVLVITKLNPLRTLLGGIVNYTSSSDEPIETLCLIDETRYKVAEGYKITVKPIDNGIETQHFYQSDFESLEKQGSIKVTNILEFYNAIKDTMNLASAEVKTLKEARSNLSAIYIMMRELATLDKINGK